MKNKWEIIHEGDTDSGKPTSWALEINHERYGKYVCISVTPSTSNSYLPIS